MCKESERERFFVDKKSTIRYSGPRVSETSLYYSSSVILKISKILHVNIKIDVFYITNLEKKEVLGN